MKTCVLQDLVQAHLAASYPRKKLRSLVPLIERPKNGVVYSDFEEVIGPGSVVGLPGVGGGDGAPEFAQFRKKAQHYLKAHLDEPAVPRCALVSR